jgi:RNA polymerase sigma factor (TIGR02999 family)
MDSDSDDKYGPRLYQEMRALARRYMSRERPDHTLQPTALVNEAFLRLSGSRQTDWRSDTHFLAMAATHMRRILVDHARAANSKKRGSRARQITLVDELAIADDRPLDVLVVDEALTRLAERSERQARVVEMRLFSGMTVGEVAAALSVSERTVKGDWRVARAWLARELRAIEP